MRASNSIYDIEEGRPDLEDAAHPPRHHHGPAGAAGGQRASPSCSPAALAKQVGDLIGLGDTAVTVWDIAKWPVLLLLVSLMFAFLYWAAPNVKQPKFRWISPGGILAVVHLARRLGRRSRSTWPTSAPTTRPTARWAA